MNIRKGLVLQQAKATMKREVGLFYSTVRHPTDRKKINNTQ